VRLYTSCECVCVCVRRVSERECVYITLL